MTHRSTAPVTTFDIEVRSVSVDDASMRLNVSVDGRDREVEIVDVADTRVVAVVGESPDGPMVTLVSEAEPNCVTEDEVACDLTQAAFDGTLEELAAGMDNDVEFRMAPACYLDFPDSGMVCLTCEDDYSSNTYCIGF